MKKYIFIVILFAVIGLCIWTVVNNIDDGPVAPTTSQIEEAEPYKLKDINGCGVEIKEVRTYTGEDNITKMIEVEMNFTNPSQEAKRFSEMISLAVYQDGIELKDITPISDNENLLRVKNGATIKVIEAFLLRSDSEVTLDFSRAYRKNVEDSISYSIK